MDFSSHPLNQKRQYSHSKPKGSNYSNSTVQLPTKEILSSISDLIPNADYNPWYAKQLKTLGQARFMELANKARAGSDTPHILFKWMIDNNPIVK